MFNKRQKYKNQVQCQSTLLINPVFLSPTLPTKLDGIVAEIKCRSILRYYKMCKGNTCVFIVKLPIARVSKTWQIDRISCTPCNKIQSEQKEINKIIKGAIKYGWPRVMTQQPRARTKAKAQWGQGALTPIKLAKGIGLWSCDDGRRWSQHTDTTFALVLDRHRWQHPTVLNRWEPMERRL